jgi:glyoxylase-like metal-dependent hydrolase (beta-lactamase superfamily II)
MTVYCLNCATLRPYFPKIHGGVTCFLVETNQGPVLVDTGFGVQDYETPTRVVDVFMSLLRVPRAKEETALMQVQQLGFQPEMIQHIIMTHLHLDHAGGLPDFPWAQIHIYAPEFHHVVEGAGGWPFIANHWSHGPNWQLYSQADDNWFGFEAIRLDRFDPEMYLIPLVGHSPGHCGLAVRTKQGWLFHAADAIPFNKDFELAPRWLVRALLGDHSDKIIQLAEHHPEVVLVGAHMDREFYQRWQPLET